MAHVFFASYARLDNDKKRLRDVIVDLRERVRSKLGARKAEEVGFFDQVDGILTAQDWQTTLAEAARRARVLVCFCSNTYFNSEYCANEFEVFRRRLRLLGTGADRVRVVIPVVWDACAVPQAVARYQDTDERAGFPAVYRQQGLLALKRNKTQKARYETTLNALALTIQQAVDGGTLPPLPGPVVFDELPGVFDNPGAYNVGVGALHDDGLRWELSPGKTVRFIVEAVAAKENLPWRAIRIENDIPQVLDAAEAAREVVVLIADEGSVLSGAWKARLDAVAAAPRATCILLIGLHGAGGALSGPAAQARLTALVPLLAAQSRVDWFPVDAPEVLRVRLSEQLVKLRMSLIKGDAAERVLDAGLAESARLEGIAVNTQPIVNGPATGRQ
jgi:TIR domain-containing protein